MKRNVTRFLFSAFVLLCLVACGNIDSPKEWTEADFSIYDEKGNEVTFAAPDETVYLEKVNEEKSGDFQTFRGVKIGMRATTALEPYDNVFYWFIMRGRESTPEEQAEETALREEYSDIHDLVANSSNFLREDEYLVINTIFHVKEDGSLIPCKMKDGICDDEQEIWQLESYELTFDVENEKISSVEIEHNAGFLDQFR